VQYILFIYLIVDIIRDVDQFEKEGTFSKPRNLRHPAILERSLNSLNLIRINQFLLLLSNCATVVSAKCDRSTEMSENRVFRSRGSSYSQNYPSPLWEICRKWRFSRRGCTGAIPQSWITRTRTSVIWTLSRSTSFPRRRASSWSTWSIKSPARYYRSSRFRP